MAGTLNYFRGRAPVLAPQKKLAGPEEESRESLLALRKEATTKGIEWSIDETAADIRFSLQFAEDIRAGTYKPLPKHYQPMLSEIPPMPQKEEKRKIFLVLVRVLSKFSNTTRKLFFEESNSGSCSSGLSFFALESFAGITAKVFTAAVFLGITFVLGNTPQRQDHRGRKSRMMPYVDSPRTWGYRRICTVLRKPINFFTDFLATSSWTKNHLLRICSAANQNSRIRISIITACMSHSTRYSVSAAKLANAKVDIARKNKKLVDKLTMMDECVLILKIILSKDTAVLLLRKEYQQY